MSINEIYLQFEKQLNSFRKFVLAEERSRRGQTGKWKIKPSELSAAKVLEFAKKLADVRSYIDAPKLVALDLIGAMSVVEVGELVSEAEMDSSYALTAMEYNYRLLAEVVHGVAMRQR